MINITRVFLLFIFLMPGLLPADTFRIREQSPQSLLYGLPLQTRVTEADNSIWQTEIIYTISNTYNPQYSRHEQLVVDVETQVLDLLLSRRINRDLQLGLHVPLIQHGAGSLDDFIIDYHDALGLPQGDRLDTASDQYLIEYLRDGDVYLRKTTATSGVGDIRFYLDYKLDSMLEHSLQVHASLKLPSGDSERLTGSGGTDFATWLSGRYTWRQNWSGDWRVGLLWMETGEVLPEQQKNFAALLGGSLSWRVAERITLGAQIDWHSALYDDTELTMLGPSLTLTTGGWLHLGPHDKIAIAVMEDIDVGTAPDVQLHFGWQHDFSFNGINE